jgi:hypothetical protein
MNRLKAMRPLILSLGLFLAPILAPFLAPIPAARVYAQAVPTAKEAVHISVFAGPSYVDTGLDRGRNASVTAGIDFELHRYLGLNPAFEVRGTFPVDKGKVDSQRTVLGGLRLASSYSRLHPYADLLFGRTRLDYDPALPDPQRAFIYVRSSSYVLSPGLGMNLEISRSFSISADAQWQRLSSPVVSSGHLDAVPVTLALVYRLNSGRRRH